ncbi:MAG: hypothetical protein ISQ13_04585 [Candidatus Margulisbacteria bacterium]|nr:hypothetical protein [Candidatus Margulisiibacteriota bacterium]
MFRLPPGANHTVASDQLKMVDVGQFITDKNFNFYLNLFENNDTFKMVTIIEPLTKGAFYKQYGENTIPVLGLSDNNVIIPGGQVDQFSPNDRWVIVQNVAKSTGQNLEE